MKAAGQPPQTSSGAEVLPRLFAALFGAFLGLTLLKFGNPPIMEKYVTAPASAPEFLLGFPWPIAWAYWILAGLALFAFFTATKTKRLALPINAAGTANPGRVDKGQAATPSHVAALPSGRSPFVRGLVLALLPLAWLAWQFLAAASSIDAQLTTPTLWHFVACVACFYIALFCLGTPGTTIPFLAGLIAGFFLVLATGFEQQFGGLAQTRAYFYTYIYPTLTDPPPEYLKKMSSSRIFSTLFYPNALAGVILLLLPPVVGRCAQARLFTPAARSLLCLIAVAAAGACLVWSGSKGGWLLLLFLGFATLLRLPFDRRIKLGLILVLLVAGLAAFGVRYAGFFRKGATSVVARFDYWRAAIQTANAHPLTGTGPGTFAKPYAAIKDPKSEMARLVHNDYLEQASDSGWPAFLCYSAFIIAALVVSYPRRRSETANLNDWQTFSIWLGVLGWALQSLFEFGLYIPGLAWPAFAFLGLLLSRDRSIEQKQSKA